MLPALAVLAGSALLKHQVNRQAQKRQDRLRGSMEAYQRSKSADSMAATEALLQKQTPQARDEEMQAVTDARAGSLRDTVGAAQAFDAPQIAGNLSPEYTRAQEAAADSVSARTKRAIEQLATMGAPGEQALKSGIRFGQTAGEVDAANNASAAVGRGYLTDIDNVRPDPLLSMVGDIGMAVGSGMIAAPAAAAPASAGSGITSGASANGLRIGAAPGIRPGAVGFQPRLSNAFSLFGRG